MKNCITFYNIMMEKNTLKMVSALRGFLMEQIGMLCVVRMSSYD